MYILTMFNVIQKQVIYFLEDLVVISEFFILQDKHSMRTF